MSPPTEKMTLSGVFITFEGIDGCGKSTQSRRLANLLRKRGQQVVETREPGGTAIGQGLRAILLDPENNGMIPQSELLLYLADRMQHLAEVITPALQAGGTVICDRFHDATVAYQHYGRGLDFAPLEALIASEITPNLPQLTFWIDTEVELAQQRIATREGNAGGLAASENSRFDRESLAFHQAVRGGYQALRRDEPNRILRVDGAENEEVIAAQILSWLEERYAF